MSEISWFGAKTLYRWPGSYSESDANQFVYEERVVVLRAGNADEAIALAEAEAVRYATDAGEGFEYLGAVDVYEMFEGIEDGSEVFSLVRTTSHDPAAFLHRYHDPVGTHARRASGDRDRAS